LGVPGEQRLFILLIVIESFQGVGKQQTFPVALISLFGIIVVGAIGLVTTVGVAANIVMNIHIVELELDIAPFGDPAMAERAIDGGHGDQAAK
jgi:hypothetical protein